MNICVHTFRPCMYADHCAGESAGNKFDNIYGHWLRHRPGSLCGSLYPTRPQEPPARQEDLPRFHWYLVWIVS